LLLFLFASPSSLSAANTETTTASGLSGATTAGPGDNVQVFSVGLTGDGTDDVTQIRMVLSDLSAASGISATAFSELRVYESTDATLDIPGDTQVGSNSTISLSSNTSVTVSTANIPNTVEYFYFGVAVIAPTITEGQAFRSVFTGGFVSTSNANLGTAFSASDANKVTLDVTATVLELTTAPADANVYDTGNDEVVSGQTFDTQRVITMKDANGNVDTSFGENIEASLTSGSGSLGGTAAVSPSSGVATFTDLAYTAASDGEGFQVTLTCPHLCIHIQS
jgi:hypothetical protein